MVDQDQWDAAVARVKKQAGALHVLMNIVGSKALGRFPHVDIDEWKNIFEINVTGTLRGIQTCAPLIKDSGGGSIINIESVAGITGNFSSGYSSSRWALEGALALRRVGLCRLGHPLQRHPARLDRDRHDRSVSNPIIKKAQAHGLKPCVLLRRSGQAEDIGYAALFLASDEASYITATDIVVDGGWSSAAPYLINERSHHVLSLMDKKNTSKSSCTTSGSANPGVCAPS